MTSACSKFYHTFALTLGFLAVTSVLSAAPQTITGVSSTTYTGLKLDNASGDCLTITGASTNIIIKDSAIGPCSGNGVHILGASTNVTLDNVTIFGIGGNGVDVSGSSTGFTIKNSTISGGTSSVYVVSSNDAQVLHNVFYNAQGPGPRGQCVQFNQVGVTSKSSLISWNTCINRPSVSAPEDAISLHACTGTSSFPMIVEYNTIKGGGPSGSGGGIMLGDSGGTYEIARNNVLVDPGQYGIAISGGQNNKIINNKIYAYQATWNNVGIYVWDVNGSGTCASHEVYGNLVNYTNSAGVLNGGWAGSGTCGTVLGWNNNDFSATNSVFDSSTVLEMTDVVCPTCKL